MKFKMKKTVLFAVIFSVIAACLCGCSVGFVNSVGPSYDNADKYTPGDREFTEKIDALDIEWVSGKLTLTADEGSTVRVKETTNADLEDKLKVHTYAEGSTLHVRFCKSGENYTLKAEKTLEITLPADILYESVKIDTSSADTTVSGVNAKSAALGASSGDITYNGGADSFNADASSGNVSFTGASGNINVNTSSGKIFIDQQGEGESISLDSSSGDMQVEAEYTAKLSASTSSGNKTIKLAKMPSETKLNSSSGAVTLYLPENAEFTANINTSSGEVSYDLALTKQGENTYTCGSGENKLSIDTSSGDVKILKQ